MKILILNSDYPEFLSWLYARHPGLEFRSYEEQMKVRAESLFGVADFYSRNLRRLGHEAWEIHCNNGSLQKAWAREKGLAVAEGREEDRTVRKLRGIARRLGRRVPLGPLKPFLASFLRHLGGYALLPEILKAQIEDLRPDVLLNQTMDLVTSRFLRGIRPCIQLLAGQIASPLPDGEDFSVYDLVVTSLPNVADRFKGLGVPTEIHPFAFEPDILQRIEKGDEAIPVSFVGSLSPLHRGRVALLEYLCSRREIQVWGTGIDRLPKGSSIRAHYRGTAWGIEMYRILRASRITLNHHIEMAGPYANNMRLFEATGVGTLLLTEGKENLHEMFEPGKEVVIYRDSKECLERIEYYLHQEKERTEIARAGQERTLREHTYERRMGELVEVLVRYMNRSICDAPL